MIDAGLPAASELVKVEKLTSMHGCEITAAR